MSCRRASAYGLREQAAHRHVDELRVAVVALAVGEDELERLGEQVDIGRRVVAERGEVVGLEQRQHLGQHRPLTPGAAREHLVLAKARAHRLLDLHLERGEIVVGQEPALRGVERGDLPRDVAAIEQIARGAKARLPSRRPRPALGVQQAADRARQVGLREDLTRFGQASIGHEHGGARRPLRELADRVPQVRCHELVHREALGRQAQWLLHDLGQAQRAVALERGDPGIGRARRDAPQDAGRDLAAAMLLEVGDARRLGPAPEPADGQHAVFLGEVDDDGRDPGQVHHVDVEHGEAEAGRHARVDGIAPAREDARARLRRQVVTRGHHAVGAHDARAVRAGDRSLTHRDPAFPAMTSPSGICAPARV